MVDEIADQSHAAGGVHHLGVELHAVEATLQMGNRGFRGVGGVRQANKSLGQGLHRVAMAHPHRGSTGDVGEQIGGIIHLQRCLAVFGLAAGGFHHTPQLLHHQLHAVADPQHRDAQLPDRRITEGRVLGVHRTGTAAEDDPLRLHRPQLLR